ETLPASVGCREHGAADHRVEAGCVAAPGGDGDLQRPAAAWRISRTISPGSACRPSFFLENTLWPSTPTSNTPPADSIILTSACGKALRISAARPAARGS